jgi:hypothetical protein
MVGLVGSLNVELVDYLPARDRSVEIKFRIFDWLDPDSILRAVIVRITFKHLGDRVHPTELYLSVSRMLVLAERNEPASLKLVQICQRPVKGIGFHFFLLDPERSTASRSLFRKRGRSESGAKYSGK